jgi:acyl carrier protein
MNDEQILNEINSVMSEMSKKPLNTDSDISLDSVLDSIELIDFLISIERKFGVKITENSLRQDNLSQIKNLIAYIGQKQTK